MGQDKALLPFRHKTLLEWLLQKINPFFEQTYVVLNQSQRMDHLELLTAQVCKDLISKAGPLAGLYTGLCVSRYSHNMVFSVDMPFVDEASILKLVQASAKNPADSCCFKTQDGKSQPFPGIYLKDSSFVIRDLLERNEKSMQRFIEVMNCRKISIPEKGGDGFKNLNYNEDYQDALGLLQDCQQ